MYRCYCCDAPSQEEHSPECLMTDQNDDNVEKINVASGEDVVLEEVQ